MDKKGFKFEFQSGKNIFFTADTHFNHANIVKYCQRPFKDVKDMNEQMIERWNAKVGADDIVFHLGDLAFGHTKEVKKVVERLNGQIYLVRGNHDPYGEDHPYLQFKNVKKVCTQLKIKVEETTIYLNHFPFLCFEHSYNGIDAFWQLFGHVHSGPTSGSGLDCRRLVHLFPTQYDVGVDNNNFTPVSYEEVKNYIYDQMMSQMLLNYNMKYNGLGWFSVKTYRMPDKQQVVMRWQSEGKETYETIFVNNDLIDYVWLEHTDAYWCPLPEK